MFKKFLIAVSVLFLLVIAAAISLAYIYEDEVKAYAIESINQQLQSKVDVSEVNFSLLKDFPMASLEFQEVIAMESWQKSQLDTLFEAESIFLKFNLWDIYHKNYQVIELEIKNAVADLKIDEAGNENYRIWKSNKENENSNNGLSFSLSKVIASKINLKYTDLTSQTSGHVFIDESRISGNFQKSVFSAHLESELEVLKFSENDRLIIQDQELAINGEVVFDLDKSVYRLDETSLSLGEVTAVLDGSIETVEGKNLELSYKGTDISLDKLLILLREMGYNFLPNIDISGNINLTGIINGNLSGAGLHYETDFHLSNGKLISKSNKLDLRNITISGSYSNGEENNRESSSITLENFTAHLGNGKINGKLSLRNFNKPAYSVESNMELELSEIIHYLDLESITDIKGKLYAVVKSKGYLENSDAIKIKDWKRANSIGSMQFEDVSFQLKNRPQLFRNISGKLKIINNSLMAENLSGEISNSDFNLNGEFINLIGYLLDEKEALLIDAAFSSDHMELNELLLSGDSGKEQAKDEDYHFSISKRINVILEAEIDKLKFKKFIFNNCKSSILIKNQILHANNIHFESMDGKVDGKLMLDASKSGYILMESSSSSKQIDVKQLFHDMDNFGQKVLTHSNIDGIATADIHFTSKWSPTLEMDLKSLVLESNFVIEKGRLMNFEPLKRLSNFISLDELNDIRFSTLQNSIQIKNEKIYIPEFDIKSSAMDLSLEGSHTFGNMIDYKMELIVDQLLGMKIKKPEKKTNSEFGYIEDDGLGRSRLFLKMSGNLHDPKISYDTQQLKEHWKDEVENEKKEIKKILKDEFGIFKKDTNIEAKETDIEKEAADPFQIEWGASSRHSSSEDEIEEKQKFRAEQTKKREKSGFNKFFDKIAEPNKDEFIQPRSE